MDKAHSEICETISQKFAETKFQHLIKSKFQNILFYSWPEQASNNDSSVDNNSESNFPDSISREKDNIFSRDCRKDLLRF